MVVVVVQGVVCNGVGGERTHLGQILVLLLLVTVADNLVDAEVAVGAIAESNGSGGAGKLLHGNHVLRVAEGRATILFRGSDAKQAKVPQLFPKVLQVCVRISFCACVCACVCVCV